MSTLDRFDWSDAAIARLRQLWSEGHSTAEIGRRLGVSKNTVIGKAHRLDLPARPSPIRTQDPSVPRPERPPRRLPIPTLPSLDNLAIPPPPTQASPEPRAVPEPTVKRRTSDVIGDKLCCWPIGQPGTRNFRFCDSPALVGKPYCPEHAELAYVKPRDRRPAEAAI